jgi:hypothetical protein
MEAAPSAPGTPLLSVLCLTYNHAAFIGRTLDSFLAQDTRFEFEVVVGDDCSTDGTPQLVADYRGRFGDRLRLLESAVNLGVSRNFRRTMNACRGKYIALCEGDDFWRGRHKLQQQVDFLEAHPDYVMAYHDATLVDQNGEHRISQLPWRLRRDATSAELVATRSISTLTVCFRHLLGELPAELDQAPALDLCLWSLLGQHGKGKYMAEIDPAGYRVHAGGVFSMQGERNRHLMTAQSLLCLSRLYTRRGDAKAADAVLLKANLMATQPLRALNLARLFALAVARLIAQPLLRFNARRRQPQPPHS